MKIETAIRCLFTAIVFASAFVASQAQTTTLVGKVTTTQGETLPGASVFLVGTYDGATTDTAGAFQFATTERGAQQLMVLFMGCDTFRQSVLLDGSRLEIQARIREKKNQLGEVVVTAGTFEATSDRRRAAVLNSLDIALTASASADIAGAIATLPGTTRNGETGQILVRGGAAYETRTFMDGLLVQNPYNSTVGNLPARNRFSPFLFKGTVFSTGGYSAEYGQAMSSALVLNTEDLAPKTMTGITLLSVGAGLAHTKRWENTSLSVSGNYNNLKPYFALVPQRIDWIKVPQAGVGEVVLRHRTNDRGGMLKYYGNFNRSYMALHADNPFEGGKTPMSLQADNIYNNASYRDVLGQWTLFAGIAHTYNNDVLKSIFANGKKHHSLQARATMSRQVGSSLRLKLGGEYLRARYHEGFQLPNEPTWNTRLGEHYGAAFVESDLFLSKKWVARAGLRSEYAHIIQKANVAPRLSVAYVLGPKEQISMSFGRFYQTPEYDQMRRTQDLNFENATHFMLNYQRMKGGYIFRAEVYQKWYDQLIKNTPDGLVNNAGSGYARGLDVFLRDNHNIKNGDYWISYSYLDTRRDWRDFPQRATPNFAMKHSASVVYKQFFPKLNTALSASYGFHSGRPFFDPNLPDAQFMTSRTAAYHDISLAVTYLTNIGGHFTVFYLSLQNVPGFNQTFGYRYATTPDATGQYAPTAIQPPAKRFGVLAVIMSIGQKYKKNEVTSDDY
jgi:hypothetical protein